MTPWKTLTMPYVVKVNHSARAGDNDGNVMHGVGDFDFSLPMPSPLLHPGDADGFRFAWWS